MLSVGMFTYSTKPRGSVVHAASVADALAREGHRVTLYALGQPGARLYRDVGCEVVVIPAREAPPQKDDLVRQRVTEFVAGLEKAPRHDVLHAQDCLAASALVASRAHRGVPIVRTVHHVERFESQYLTDCQRRSVLLADEVFSVSRATQREVVAAFGRSSRLVANGVDIARFAGPLPPWSWLEERLGVAPGAQVVLSVGGVEERKNSRRALAAFARASASRADLAWVIAGGSSIWDHSAYSASFDADLAQLPGETRRRVHRTGPLGEAEMTALYRLADVLLFPSLKEGFGLCVLEAMAAGLPVVVPRDEPFVDYLDESCAALVDASSESDIARALSALLADADARIALARAARGRARSFPWGRAAALHAQHYAALLRRHAPERLRHA